MVNCKPPIKAGCDCNILQDTHECVDIYIITVSCESPFPQDDLHKLNWTQAFERVYDRINELLFQSCIGIF